MIITSQTKTAEDFELLPDPERIVNGLRDTGYNFNTAIADIVDNSIAANATKVNIEVNMDPNKNIRVYIADNGCGMDLDGLKNANEIWFKGAHRKEQSRKVRTWFENCFYCILQKILFALKNSRRNGVAQGAVGLGLYRS